jgi:cytochrome c-type biogenesis protein
VIDFESLRLGFAFGAGTATFFAPCAWPLLPGYVAYYLGKSGEDTTPPLRTRLLRAGIVGVLTSVGFFIVYAALAGVVLAVGTQALQNVSVLELIVGVLLIGLGSAMALGKFSASSLHIQLPERERSGTSYVMFGIIYAAAAAGCTAPLFIGIASLAISGSVVTTIATLGAYAAGMSVLMIGVTMMSALGRDTILRRLSAKTGLISRVAGAVMVVAGLVQIYFFLFRFDGLSMLGLA